MKYYCIGIVLHLFYSISAMDYAGGIVGERSIDQKERPPVAIREYEVPLSSDEGSKKSSSDDSQGYSSQDSETTTASQSLPHSLSMTNIASMNSIFTDEKFEQINQLRNITTFMEICGFLLQDENYQEYCLILADMPQEEYDNLGKIINFLNSNTLIKLTLKEVRAWLSKEIADYQEKKKRNDVIINKKDTKVQTSTLFSSPSLDDTIPKELQRTVSSDVVNVIQDQESKTSRDRGVTRPIGTLQEAEDAWRTSRLEQFNKLSNDMGLIQEDDIKKDFRNWLLQLSPEKYKKAITLVQDNGDLTHIKYTVSNPSDDQSNHIHQSKKVQNRCRIRILIGTGGVTLLGLAGAMLYFWGYLGA